MTLLAVLPGCGRINFDPLRATDAALDTTAPVRCDPQAPFTTIARVDSLSSTMIDGGARLSADETVAYFHSDRGIGTFQLWSATRTSRDVAFEAPTVVLATTAFWPTVTSDGLTLVYSTADLLRTTRGATSQVFPVGTVILDSTDQQTSPLLGPLGTTLYFSTYEVDGNFHAAPWPGVGSMQSVAGLNTTSQEESLAFSDDELVVYFSRQTTNNPDIYMAQRDSVTASFGPATEISVLNSASTDKPTSLSPDLCRLYFETDRNGTNSDIWLAERQP